VIEAKVWAVCDVPPRKHTLRVWLEKEASDGRTFYQVGRTETWQSMADIPPATGRDYTIQILCAPGIWRLRAAAEGISADGEPFSFSLPVSELHLSVIPKCGL